MYAAILLAALVLNKESLKTLLLILLVALTHYLPVHLITNYYAWYSVCIGAEIFIIVASLLLLSTQALLNVAVTFLLLAAHIASYFSDAMKNYHIIAVSLAYIQMLCFIVASPKVLDYAVSKLTPLLSGRT